MAENLVWLFDGTWDGFEKDNLTNVQLLSRALATIPGEQYSRCNDGVGDRGDLITRLLDGAFGLELFELVKDGYEEISLAYEQDSRLFLFGFSRGAYTARSVAGMIAVCGLPLKPFNDNCINTAFRAYRSRDPQERSELLDSIRDRYGMYDAKITMVGVWDTVGALGIPALAGGIDPLLYGFLDTGLHPDVERAYHAIAIDEQRAAFSPTLWTGPFAPGQIVEQVWFTGAHSNVGGGCADTGLSDITLGWMMQKAASLGLKIDPATLAQYSNIAAKQSLALMDDPWSLVPYGPRVDRTVPADATLGNSVAIRCLRDVDVPYQPANLTLTAGTPANTYRTEDVVAAWP